MLWLAHHQNVPTEEPRKNACAYILTVMNKWIDDNYVIKSKWNKLLVVDISVHCNTLMHTRFSKKIFCSSIQPDFARNSIKIGFSEVLSINIYIRDPDMAYVCTLYACVVTVCIGSILCGQLSISAYNTLPGTRKISSRDCHFNNHFFL